MVDLSTIIVSWNTRDLLADLLASLASSAFSPQAEIIVIDNASIDGSPEMVAERFPQVTLIRNNENVGYARANNQGIARAKGHYLLLLNSDVILPEGALDDLIHFMEENPDVGVCSPRLLTGEGQPQAYAFGQDPSLGYLLRRGVNRLVLNRSLHDWGLTQVTDVDWVSGACMLLRRDALTGVDGLDESFFMYFEDVDLCRRIRRRGWRICYVPSLAVTHLGGQSLKQNPQAQRAYQQSLLTFYAKHYHPVAQILLRGALGIYNLLR